VNKDGLGKYRNYITSNVSLLEYTYLLFYIAAVRAYNLENAHHQPPNQILTCERERDREKQNDTECHMRGRDEETSAKNWSW
jgi:hypothetical protein